MKCLIISGGRAPGRRLIDEQRKGADLIIGVDGAADLLYGYGIIPQALIGDFDTADAQCVNELKKKGSAVISLEAEKNETDTEAAVDYAASAGADEIVILGALGGRIDHLLSNIMMLVRACKTGVKCSIIDENCELFASDNDFMITGVPGQTVSILPLTGQVCVRAQGLKYPLDDLKLEWGSSRGISNVMNGERAMISISGGYALIVKNRLNP